MPSGKNKPPTSSAAKSAKALKAAKSRSGGAKKGSSAVKARQVPWLTLGAAVVVVGLIAAIAVYLVPQFQDRAAAQQFVPSADNPDPSSQIDGVVTVEYEGQRHVTSPQRVAYDQSPPFGGPHDASWATCTGVLYPDGLRTENAVHSLEHGAVWITYNPDELAEDQVAALAAKVEGQPFMLMSAYPGLDSPVSLQSWGHQLKLDDPADERVDQFITALRLNSNTYPEVGATCDNNPATFDVDNPPPFDATAPGPDAEPMTGGTEVALDNGTEPAPVPTDPALVPTDPAAVPTDPAAVPTEPATVPTS